ncbi:MAG: hypothetical protein ACYC96_08665 [Fimbriimonadaceae bacterium]
MNIRGALKGQYHAGLKMLRQCVERCPDTVWVAGEHPRTFWRIAYHGTFFTHLYLQQNEAAFRPWEKAVADADCLWESPPVIEAYSKADMLDYIDLVDSQVDATVDALDLETSDSGFPWYPSIDKLGHELMNIRHLQGHVGQLSERLMADGVDTDWAGNAQQRERG